LKARIVTGTLLALSIVGGVIYLPLALIALVLGSFLVVAAWEWAALSGWQSASARISYTCLVAAFAIAVWHWNDAPGFFFYASAVAVFWWSLSAVFVIFAQQQKLGTRIRLANNPAIGVLVLSCAWSSVVWLLCHDRTMLLGLFSIVWLADAAAFFVGRRWGRRRLASNLSPGKSWEGAAGGLAFAAFGTLIFATTIELSGAASMAFLAVAIIAVCASIVGDLFESILKRNTGLKDSGQILPGHGGVLDRIDGFVAAAPIFVVGLHGWVDRL
jgi:phosphatidate cytidylyltransferase